MILLYHSLLVIYQKESKSAYNRDTCILMFIMALFTIVKLCDSIHINRRMDKENIILKHNEI
jgi:hypothetical protein